VRIFLRILIIEHIEIDSDWNLLYLGDTNLLYLGDTIRIVGSPRTRWKEIKTLFTNTKTFKFNILNKITIFMSL